MISDPWIIRATPLEPKRFKTSEERRLTSRDRQTELRDLKRCINGPMVGNVGRTGIVHGPVVSKCGRCQRCLDVKQGKAVAS